MSKTTLKVTRHRKHEQRHKKYDLVGIQHSKKSLKTCWKEQIQQKIKDHEDLKSTNEAWPMIRRVRTTTDL
jgi:hypothetical protein